MTERPVSSYAAERSRVEIRVGDELVAWVDLRPGGSSTIIAHTEVVAGHERQGLGQVAVRAAVEHIAGEGKSLIASARSPARSSAAIPSWPAPDARRRPRPIAGHRLPLSSAATAPVAA
jgi:predicted GNAT family acetyltransferase